MTANNRMFAIISSGIIVPRAAIIHAYVGTKVVPTYNLIMPHTSNDVFEIDQRNSIITTAYLVLDRAFFGAKKGQWTVPYTAFEFETNPKRVRLENSDVYAAFIANYTHKGKVDSERGINQVSIRIDRILKHIQKKEMIDMLAAQTGSDAVEDPENDVEIANTRNNELVISQSETDEFNKRIEWLLSRFNSATMAQPSDEDDDNVAADVAESVEEMSFEDVISRNILSEIGQILDETDVSSYSRKYKGMLSDLSSALSAE